MRGLISLWWEVGHGNARYALRYMVLRLTHIVVQISHILLCRPENGKFFREIILGVKYTTGRSPGSIETIKKYIPSRLPYGLDL